MSDLYKSYSKYIRVNDVVCDKAERMNIFSF